MTKSYPIDACTTDGMPHEWEYVGSFTSRFTLHTCFAHVCRTCGKRKTRISNNRRDNDSIDREVAA